MSDPKNRPQRVWKVKETSHAAELQSDRLIMREMALDDAAALLAMQNRPEQWQRTAVEPEEFADGALRLHKYFEHRGPETAQRVFVYVAYDKTRSTLIGDIGLSRFFHPEIASLGLGVAYDYWGQGYATEMAERVLAFGFDQLRLHRISADVALENAPCQRVMQKLGMRHEGDARDCIWAQGRWWSEAKYAMLEPDYRACRLAVPR